MDTRQKTSSISGFLAPQLLVRKRSSSRDAFNNSPILKSDLKKSSKFLEKLEEDNKVEQQEMAKPQPIKQTQPKHYRNNFPPNKEIISPTKPNRYAHPSSPDATTAKQLRDSLQSFCLDIREQSRFINGQLEQFERSLKKLIESEYQKLKEAIIIAVEDIFEHSKEKIAKLYKLQAQFLNKDLYNVHQELQKVLDQLENIKKGLDGYNWKAVMHQYIEQKSQIEDNVHSLLQQSRDLKINLGIKLYFDDKKSQAFGDAFESLLQLSRKGQKKKNSFKQ